MGGKAADDLGALNELLKTGQFESLVSAAQHALDDSPENPTHHVFLGAGLAGLGKLDPAIGHYRRALSLKPEYFEAAHGLAQALQKLERYSEAGQCYVAAQKLIPNNAEYSKIVGKLLPKFAGRLFNANKLSEAAATYRLALYLQPNNPQILIDFGTVLMLLREFDEAYVQLDAGTQIDLQNISALSALAMTARALGKPYSTALTRILAIPAQSPKHVSTLMWAAVLLGLPEKAFSFKSDALNVLDYAEFANLAGRLPYLISMIPPLQGELPACNARPLIYAAMDGAYAEIFAADLIQSARTKCPTCDFHLHLMNPGTFDSRKLPPDRVTCSFEAMPYDKTLYSTRRFVRLAQLLNDREIIAVDADTIFNGDVVKVLPAAFDVILYERLEEAWAHQMFNAGFVAVAPGGREFVKFLAAYILNFEVSGTAQWFLDQMGILAAKIWLQKTSPTLSIVAAPAHMMDWTVPHKPESIIWHAKGTLKRISERP